VFVEREAPEEIEEARVQAGGDGTVHIPGVMAQAFGMSRSEARRLIEQGGVSLDDAQLGANDLDVGGVRADGAVLKVGKRRFRRLRVS
jgi:tyrosyl-tRNA synthetase